LETLEIEVLELLNSIRVLDSLYFGGGTMLRLCHNLNRYSTDLDFWVKPEIDSSILFPKIKNELSKNYTMIDAANKRFTMLFEFRTAKVNRNLKIEIRKGQQEFEWERKIAFSSYSNKQVVVKGLTLPQMMTNKIEAALSRKIIRDIFDIEFLLMRGIKLQNDKKKLEALLKIAEGFTDRDFKTTLGSILDNKERKFYTENKFRFLKEEIRKEIFHH